MFYVLFLLLHIYKFLKEKFFSHFVTFFLFLEYKSTQYQNMTERSFQSNNHNIFILLRCSRCICTNTIHIHEAKRLEWMVIEQWTLLQMVNNYIIRQCTKQMEQLGLSGGSRARRDGGGISMKCQQKYIQKIRVETQQQQQIHFFLDATGEPGCYASCYASAPVVTNAQLVLTCFHQAESGSMQQCCYRFLLWVQAKVITSWNELKACAIYS